VGIRFRRIVAASAITVGTITGVAAIDSTIACSSEVGSVNGVTMAFVARDGSASTSPRPMEPSVEKELLAGRAENELRSALRGRGNLILKTDSGVMQGGEMPKEASGYCRTVCESYKYAAPIHRLNILERLGDIVLGGAALYGLYKLLVPSKK
jgi:hypothetical protein